MPEEKKITGFIVSWWQIFVGIASTLILAGAMYGTFAARMTEHEDHLRQLDQDTVKKEQFDEMKVDIRDRLQRIENKLDQDDIRPKH